MGQNPNSKVDGKKAICNCLVALSLFISVGFIAADCPLPDNNFPNGNIIYENPSDSNLTEVADKYILRFRCDKRYHSKPPLDIFCMRTKWSDDIPQCVKLSCRRPPVVRNGKYKIQKGTSRIPIVGSIAQYSCNLGYEIEDQNTTSLTCVLGEFSAVWNGTLPTCVGKEKCPDPGVSSDGRRTGNCCFSGDIVTYTCKKNYLLIGYNTSVCLLGGKWSSPRAKCLPPDYSCPDPPLIENGVVSGTKTGDFYALYDEVEVVCDPGYAFYGENKYVYCDETSNWHTEFGECKETFCQIPEIPANGTISELESTNATEFPYKFELNYACNLGFRLVGDSFRCCSKGNWAGEEPYCEAVKCYDPGVPENGQRLGSNFEIGQKVVYDCFSGYYIIGSTERYCLSNGQWSGELARCDTESNFCENPGIPINGKKIGSNYGEGDTVKFRCNQGFTLLGSDTRECLSSKIWSGQEVKCIGANDFDNINDVSEVLKVAISNNVEFQVSELEKYEDKLMSNKKTVQHQRILDLNYPGRLILYFLFDVSGSVRLTNFQTSINFAKAIVKKVGISPDGARAGALTFSSKAEEQFSPVHFTTTEEVLDELGKIRYTSGGTATNSALRLVREEMIPLSRQYLGRKNVKSVVFILTDGKANMGGSPEEQASKLKEAGVEIYCIGITGSIKKNGLYKIASEPSNEHVFILDNYKLMEWLVQEITNGTIDYSQCGLGFEKLEKRARAVARGRAIGGKKVVEPWPWMAALYYQSDALHGQPTELRCGGSVVGQFWILTAAHCLWNNEESQFRNEREIAVHLGLTDVNNVTLLQVIAVEKFFPHPKYNPENKDNDIALIKLNRLIEFNAYVRPICLPPSGPIKETDFYKTNSIAYATGWGHSERVEDWNNVQITTTSNLKELLLPLQKRSNCLQSFLDEGGQQERFTATMFCAGNGKGDVDTCVGDSGGPLMQSRVNEQDNVYWTQIGIVSWGIGCGKANTYGYYTHVQKLVNWVHSVMNAVGNGQ